MFRNFKFVSKSAKKSISSKRCGRESVEFMLSKEGNRLPFTLGIKIKPFTN